MKLRGKKILLGVTGSIAAYKTAELVRLLIKEGAEVQVIMTESARDFITPVTLGTLSGKPVLTAFSQPDSGTWNNHVELGLWGDALLIAPASASTLSKMAHGRSDNLLTAVYLSARCPVFIAPAMDLDMYAHSSTQQNIDALVSLGCTTIGPSSGALASGLSGEGRMTEPEEIRDFMVSALSPEPAIIGKKILITAGPTREPIDPVRFLSNRSSGKMGVALAKEFAARGGEVTLIAGPGVKIPTVKNIRAISVTTAAEMFEACMKQFPETDITVMAAAVADFTPESYSENKIKKLGATNNINMVPTTDILAAMGGSRKKGQFIAGFALETTNEMEYAREKLKAKNLDLIVLNSLNDPGAGFETDTNKITLIDKNNQVTSYGLKSKSAAAHDIVDKIISLL